MPAFTFSQEMVVSEVNKPPEDDSAPALQRVKAAV